MSPERRRVFRDMRPPVNRRPIVTRPPSVSSSAPSAHRLQMQSASASPARQQSPVPPRSPRSFKKLLWLFLILLAVALLALPAWYFLAKRGGTGDSPGGTKITGGSQSDNTIRLLAAGDFIAHDSINEAAKQGDSYSYINLMDDFPAIFKKSDIRFCNDSILNGGKRLGITGYPYFNSPTEFVTDMGRLGCNLVNTASNHSFDFGQANIDASVDAWDAVPNTLAVAGENRSQQEHDAVHYFTVKGVKFAFLAYTSYVNSKTSAAKSYGVNQFSEDFARQQISEAKANGARAIIVSMRWGTEYSGQVDDRQKSQAQFLADNGVQLVLGHGPHVLQPVETLTGTDGNKTIVWYSLGNFLNSQIPAETLFNGVAVIDFDIKANKFTTMQFLPIYMHYEWTAAQAKAEDAAARKNLHLYLLEDANQRMIDDQQLDTTIAEQKRRISDTLSQNGVDIPLITSKQY